MKLTNLITLEETMNLVPLNAKDEKAINDALASGIELTIDELNRVFGEGNIYIADLVEVEE